jgi:poly(hydroxyalkanoate) depolymerase family esterase
MKGFMRLSLATVVATAVLALSATVAQAAPVAGQAQTFAYGHGNTAYSYIVYTPKGWVPEDHWPLLVMVHGCETTAAEQMGANLYNPLADKDHFVVMYPDSDPSENALPGPLRRCWMFYNPLNYSASGPDTSAIADMTMKVMSNWNIDAQRVYLMGMSAGAFMSAYLAGEYPQLYAASGENAGGSFANGSCVFQSLVALPVTTSAQLALSAMGANARVVPRIVIGGSADQGLPPACATEALLQGLRTDNLVLSGSQTKPISLSPASVTSGKAPVPNGLNYTVSNYLDAHRCLIGQRWLVMGMNHFWSGGSANPIYKSFTDPQGPSAAQASWNFFSRFTLNNTTDACAPGAAPPTPTVYKAPTKKKRKH